MQTRDNCTNSSDCKDPNLSEAGLASTDTVTWGRTPNPGEVEWDLADLQADTDLEGKMNIRHLDFSVKPPLPGEEASRTQVGFVTLIQQMLAVLFVYLFISAQACIR